MDNHLPADDKNLTPQGENPSGSAPKETIPSTEGGDLDLKTKAGFQTALTKSKEAEKKEKEAREKAETELAELREEKRKAKLAELDETERLKIEKQELEAKLAKSDMRNFASKELSLKGIPLTDPIAEIVMESPWAIPFIKRSLGESPSWAEVVKVVEEKLPSYLDDYVSRKGEKPKGNIPPTETTTTPSNEDGAVDPERPGEVIDSKKIWTRAEIEHMSDEFYLKHRDDIQLAEKEGRIQ